MQQMRKIPQIKIILCKNTAKLLTNFFPLTLLLSNKRKSVQTTDTKPAFFIPPSFLSPTSHHLPEPVQEKTRTEGGQDRRGGGGGSRTRNKNRDMGTTRRGNHHLPVPKALATSQARLQATLALEKS
jgi:hypothetical protein